MSKTAIYYIRRGLIEIPAPRNGKPGYRWAEGYSTNGKTGLSYYPWQTRRQCQAEAKALGAKAVFINPNEGAQA